MLKDTFEAMHDDGVKNVITFVTSTFSSYSGCRKYREDLYVANEALGNPFKVDKLRLGFNHPGFIEAVCSRAKDAIDKLGLFDEKETIIFFTAHSLPLSMSKHTKYVTQLKEASSLVANSLMVKNWDLIFQSNNASYGEPWLEPDIEDAIKNLSSRGYKNLVIVPIGFVCDHMEVVLDLDIEAQSSAKESNINMVRAKTVGDHPAYISSMAELIKEEILACELPEETHVFFTAHGVPRSYVEEAGDPYQDQIQNCSLLIIDQLENSLGFTNSFSLAYQSRVGPEEWLKPYTEEVLEELTTEVFNEIEELYLEEEISFI